MGVGAGGSDGVDGGSSPGPARALPVLTCTHTHRPPTPPPSPPQPPPPQEFKVKATDVGTVTAATVRVVAASGVTACSATWHLDHVEVAATAEGGGGV